MFHNPGLLSCLVCTFAFYDAGHTTEKNFAKIDSSRFDIPASLQIDLNTYWAGSEYFCLKEIEVYTVNLKQN